MRNTTRKILLTLIVSCVLPPSTLAAGIIVNAKVWTGNPEQPWAKAIVVKDKRIVAVGDAALVREYGGLEVIDAGGNLVLPGFIDNHTHFMDGSASLVSVKTQAANTRDTFVNTIRTFATTAPKDQWITGGLWDHESWGGELPHKDWIDEHTPDNPLFLLRTDGHMGLANSHVLKLAGITKESPDPKGGVIVRDEDGEPTGILKDNAMNAVLKVLPALGEAQISSMFNAGMQEALKNGVTQIHNMSNWDNIEIFEKAKAAGRLKIRVYYFPHISHRHKLAEKIKEEGAGDNWLRFGGVKELVDGSLGSTTAWFYQPYSDEPDNSGFPLMKMEDLKTSIEEAHAYGLQLAIHGIGDQANDQILNIFENLELLGHRPRIEHAQHLSNKAVPRFAALGVVPSMHPYHAIDDGRWAEKRIGKERLKGTYAFNALFDAGAKVSFGSDWSVAPLNPIAGIYAAVTRRTLDEKNPDGWVPEQKITVEQAVKAYTINNAWSGKQEKDLGTIEVGKLADLVVLSQNIFEIDPKDIINTRVTMTIIDGNIAYQEEPAP